ncbi:MAG: hypothetical protein ACR2N3_10955, partial [Pyrinomonadaceae bacterium]
MQKSRKHNSYTKSFVYCARLDTPVIFTANEGYFTYLGKAKIHNCSKVSVNEFIEKGKSDNS